MPKTGPAGTIVTIDGHRFAPMAAGNRVFFGGIEGRVLEASPIRLRVEAPVAAGIGPLQVMVDGLSVWSPAGFRLEAEVTHEAGDSLFGAASTLPLASQSGVQALATPDLDGDGRPDLVTANFHGGGISLFLNRSTRAGELAFDVRQDVRTGAFPTGVIAADFNGDGAVDLAVLNRGDRTVTLLENHFAAGRGLVVVTNVPLSLAPSSLAVGDLDGDGLPDLLVAEVGRLEPVLNGSQPGGSVVLRRGDPVVVWLDDPATVAMADLDGDGLPEIIATRFLRERVAVWRNASAPGRVRLDLVANLPQGLARDLTTADFNGDGLPDLALVLAGTDGGVTVRRNSSAPAAMSEGTLDNDILTTFPSLAPGLVAADVTGDGLPDLVVTDDLSNDVRILVNGLAGGGRFVEDMWGTPLRVAVGGQVSVASVADFDGDGLADLVVGGLDVDALRVLRNQLAREFGIGLTSPAPGAVVAWGAVVPLKADVYWGDTAIDRVEINDSGAVVGIARTSPFSFDWSGTIPGRHSVRAVAWDNSGQSLWSRLVEFEVRIANDAFTNAPALSGILDSARGSNVGATTEPGEPLHAGVPGGHSIWWRYVAPTSGVCRVSTAGSSFDTVLAVYRGDRPDRLALLASSDDADGLPTSGVEFLVTSGQEYRIAVDGYGGASGEVQIGLALTPTAPVPENDRFDARSVISGSQVALVTSNLGAEGEASDPPLLPSQSHRTLWWSWVAPASGQYALELAGTRFDHVVALYRGSALPGLELKGRAAGFLCCGAARLVFQAEVGVEYAIEVDGLNGGAGEVRLALTPVVIPSNDDFARRVTLSGFPLAVEASNTDATREAGERPVGRDQASHSVWWQWVSPVSGTVVMTTAGTEFPHLMAVFQGAVLTNLSLVASNTGTECCLPGRLLFEAQAGTPYVLLVDGRDGGMGAVRFRLDPVSRPSNDRFADAPVVRGDVPLLEGTNLDATSEPGEPLHGVGAGGHSVWWTWVAEADGALELSTEGTGFNTWVSVYVGEDVAGLQRVAAFRDLTRQAGTMDVTGGTRYHLAVDGDGYQQGAVRMRLTRVTRPANDAFARRVVLQGASAQVTGSNAFASKEPGEPNHAAFDGGKSVWWSWNSGNSPVIVISAEGTAFDHLLGVYTGTSVDSLSEAGSALGLACCGPARVVLDNVPGTVYQIAVDGLGGAAGDIHLSVASATRPANDSFIGRPSLGGNNATWTGANINATKRFDEPNHGGNPGGKSIWWHWTAPSSGSLRLALSNADFDTILAIYLGDALNALTPVASSIGDRDGATNGITLNVVGGTDYDIALDGVGGQEGHVRLDLSFTAGEYLISDRFRDGAWVPDGPVHSMVEKDGVLYVGGRFNFVRPNRGSGIALDIDYLDPVRGFPEVDGEVLAVVSDGGNGWYLGGRFRSVGGVACANFAHVFADGTVDSNPPPLFDGAVRSLAVSQNTLFAGGDFQFVNRQPHAYLAALDLAGGIVLDWDPGIDGPVTGLLENGGEIHIAGEFTQIAGFPRRNFAVYDWNATAVDPWAPDPDGHVYAMAVSCDTLYLGGDFTVLAGVPRSGLSSVSLATRAVTSWDPSPDCAVFALAPDLDRVYVGGCFDHIGGVAQSYVARVDANTGQVDAWDPLPDRPVSALAVAGGHVFAGGPFREVGGRLTGTLVVLDPVTAESSDVPIQASGLVNALSVSGRFLFAGGPTLGLGGVPRDNLVALDLATGRPTEWNPGTDGEVFRLLLRDSTLYVGGAFGIANGQARPYLAAFHLPTRALQPWTPAPDGTVYALANAGAWVVAGGDFQRAGAASRQYVAAWNASDGKLVPGWQPGLDGVILDLQGTGDAVFLAGEFRSVSGRPHRGIAKVDRSGGGALPWDPELNGSVRTCALDGRWLWVGGEFTQAGDMPRRYLAAIDVGTGLQVPGWNADFAGPVRALVSQGDSLYVAGPWRFPDGDTSEAVLRLDRTDGTYAGWSHRVDEPAGALHATGAAVYAGGAFQRLDNQVLSHLAVFPAVGFPSIDTLSSDQLLPAGAPVSLSASVDGLPPLRLQWRFNGAPIAGATNRDLVVSPLGTGNAGIYTLAVSNGLGQAVSREVLVQMAVWPTILEEPRTLAVAPGHSAVFSVTVAGSPRPRVQWRHNGVLIPGAVDATLVVTNVTLADGGRYSALVQSQDTTIETRAAELLVLVPALGLANGYADRPVTNSFAGSGRGSNVGATREPGEPQHGGRPGSASLWYGWKAPASGVVVFSTEGSSIDTVLAVYTNRIPGGGVSTLAPVASDDDRGGFLTSLVSFEAVAGVEYAIAIDSVGNSTGMLFLSWKLVRQVDRSPRIVVPPASLVVASGSTATFEVTASSATPVHYTWYHNCLPVPDSDGAQLVVPRVRPGSVGRYHVVVRNGAGSVQSLPADLVAIDGLVATEKAPVTSDKLADLVPGTVSLAGFDSAGYLKVGNPVYFDTFSATKDLEEPNHCGVRGGASKWIPFRVDTARSVVMSTEGSSFNTTLAVYLWNGGAYRDLVPVACDADSGEDRRTSLLSFDAVPGVTYFVVVDGVDGATGVVRLSATTKRLLSRPVAVAGQYVRMRLWGEPSQTYDVQVSGDLQRWETLLTTNALPESVLITDPFGARLPTRFYRAIQQLR